MVSALIMVARTRHRLCPPCSKRPIACTSPLPSTAQCLQHEVQCACLQADTCDVGRSSSSSGGRQEPIVGPSDRWPGISVQSSYNADGPTGRSLLLTSGGVL